MIKGKKIGVVVPAYNEEKLIGKVLETMPKYIDKIIVVDDCSSDGTSEIVSSFKNRLKGKLILLKHKENQGVGASLISGYRESIRQEMDIAIVMAGDAQMDPKEIPGLIQPILENGAGYVKGNRLLRSEVKRIMPGIRYFGNSMLTILTKIASGYWHVMDPQNGYTAITIETLKKIPFETLYKRYGYPNHLLVMLNVYNIQIADVSMAPVYGQEQSKLKIWKVMPKISLLLLSKFLWRLKQKYFIRDFHPLLLFYLLGFLSTFAGGILAIYFIYLRFFRGLIATTPSILFNVVLLIMGIQFILFAMWFDMEYNRKNEA